MEVKEWVIREWCFNTSMAKSHVAIEKSGNRLKFLTLFAAQVLSVVAIGGLLRFP